MLTMKANQLPNLSQWSLEAHDWHKATQILGAIRMLTRERVPNYLELALRIEATGLSAEQLPSGGELRLDFERAAMICKTPQGQEGVILLEGHSQLSLLEAVLEKLQAQGQALVEHPIASEFLAALAKKGHNLNGSLKVTDTAPLKVTTRAGMEYIRVLNRVFTATARHRARLVGPQTPIVVWAEHFDLSTLWFASSNDNEQAPHMNFGFAPFDGEFKQPYLYAYAYPMPENFEQLELPAGAQWHTSTWKGVYVPYAELEKHDDPEAFIEASFAAIYTLLAPTLR
jgi:hypothetical protein